MGVHCKIGKQNKMSQLNSVRRGNKSAYNRWDIRRKSMKLDQENLKHFRVDSSGVAGKRSVGVKNQLKDGGSNPQTSENMFRCSQCTTWCTGLNNMWMMMM